MHYVRQQHQHRQIRLQIIVPKKFLEIQSLEKEIPQTTAEIAQDMEDFWKTMAGQRLNKSREAYLNSLKVGKTKAGNITMTLTGAGRYLETGEEFNLKPGFLASTKKEMKYSKTRGPYKIIPLDVPEGKIFRPIFASQASDTSSWMWNRKGTGKVPVRIVPEVVDQTKEVFIPERIRELLERAWGV